MSLDQLFEDEPFSYFATKSGLIQISYNGKTITTLSGKDGMKFISKVESVDRKNAQLLMAKATGNFKHGNERITKNN